jgi:hypothetical protein
VRAQEKFSPAQCRDRVLHGGFTHLDMARAYLKYYEHLLVHGRLGAADEPAPRTAPDFNPKQLLAWSATRVATTH